MYDRVHPVFTINKNDAQFLDQFQINKAKYWFQKFIGKFFLYFNTWFNIVSFGCVSDIYNNGFITWSDIEFQLSVII